MNRAIAVLVLTACKNYGATESCSSAPSTAVSLTDGGVTKSDVRAVCDACCFNYGADRGELHQGECVCVGHELIAR